jgi:NADP-dependent 3-hydroxy acid dehydrogenase YdfG
MSQLVWLITGCSSGFGELLVLRALARGDLVIATARKLERIKHLEKAGAVILQLDVTDSQQTLYDTAAKAISIYGKIDVLVNNAAYIMAGSWEDLE